MKNIAVLPSFHHLKKLHSLVSIEEMKALEFHLLESMKQVLFAKNQNKAKILFTPYQSDQKDELINEIIVKAENRSLRDVTIPLLLRRRVLKLIARALAKKIRQNTLSKSVTQIMQYLDNLYFIKSSKYNLER